MLMEYGWGVGDHLEYILGGHIDYDGLAFKEKLFNRFPVFRRLPWFFFFRRRRTSR